MRQTLQLHLSITGIFFTSSCSSPSTLRPPGMAISIMIASLSVLSIKTMSGLLAPIPQYLEIFTFHHSLQLLYAPVISSFQSTYTTKLPMAIPWHVIMFSNIFYSHGPPLSLTSAHSVWKKFCCAINGKSRTICSQRLFLGTSHVIYQQIPSFPLTYCSFILFPSILSSSPLLHLFILLSIHCV